MRDRKKHPVNTPFGYCLLPLLSATLLRELSRGTPSSSEWHSEGGVMTVYRIRLKEKVDQAALHGLLSRGSDLHLTLISVSPQDAESPSREEAKEQSP